jgi:hypothetical protein
LHIVQRGEAPKSGVALGRLHVLTCFQLG